jgi:trimeric autotransporter adhesin
MKRSKLRNSVSATLACITGLLFAFSLSAQTVTTVVGGARGNGGRATNASLNSPNSVAQDSSGNLYVSEFDGQRIRKITPGGVISTYAGTGIAGYNGDNIAANTAQLYFPAGLAFDSVGNLVVADGVNNRVRKISPSGIITTFAGTGAAGYSGDGGLATVATFNQPFGLTYDAAGNLYITDIGNCVVRVVNTSNIINTYAGNGTCGFGGDKGQATSATLDFPRGIVTDGHGNLYIADTNNFRVRVVNAAGLINTFAGNGVNGFSGDGGPAASAEIGAPRALAFRSNTLFISRAGKNRVRTVPLNTRIINTYAGSNFGYDGDGLPLPSSQFAGMNGILVDSAGALLVVDGGNNRLRKASNGVMKTIAGGYIGDNKPATRASLVVPEAIAFDKSGNYYVAESDGNRVRKVSATGTITTIAGTGVSGYSGDGGPGTAATLWFPVGVAADSSGNVFVADQFGTVIREIDTQGTINNFSADPRFLGIETMVADSANNLYAADTGSCVIWKITPAAVVSIVAGVQGTCSYNSDHISATTAYLNTPYGVALDTRGGLYIADSTNNRIRKVAPNGIITTIVGDGNCGFSGDGGLGTLAEVCFPTGVVVSGNGSVYMADTANLRIRKLAGGAIKTYAGTGISGFNGDGAASTVNFDDPVALAFNPNGALFVVDDLAELVRTIK